MAQMENNLPAMQDTWVQSLGREDPLENRMATPSSILAWRVPWTEETRGLQSDMIERLTLTDHQATGDWWRFFFEILKVYKHCESL